MKKKCGTKSGALLCALPDAHLDPPSADNLDDPAKPLVNKAASITHKDASGMEWSAYSELRTG